MRKKYLPVLLSIILATFTGCVEAIELDEQQEAKFVGYAVNAVLLHDNNYMIGLNEVELEGDVDTPSEGQTEQLETSNPEQKPDKPTSKPSDDKPSSGVGNAVVSTVSMEKALGIDGISMTFKDIIVCDSYPKDNGEPAFVITALPDHKCVVIVFEWKNTTSSDIKLDLKKKYTLKGVFNSSVKVSARETLLLNDINTFDGTIGAGKTNEMVIVYEMSAGNAANIKDAVIEVKTDNGTNTVRIK